MELENQYVSGPFAKGRACDQSANTYEAAEVMDSADVEMADPYCNNTTGQKAY